MPYLVFNVFTDDSIVLYRLLGIGSSVEKSIVLAQTHLDKYSIEERNGNVTLHGHPFENYTRVNASLMLSRKEVENRWEGYTHDHVLGYVIENVNLNEPIRDKAYRMAWV